MASRARRATPEKLGAVPELVAAPAAGAITTTVASSTVEVLSTAQNLSSSSSSRKSGRSPKPPNRLSDILISPLIRAGSPKSAAKNGAASGSVDMKKPTSASKTLGAPVAVPSSSSSAVLKTKMPAEETKSKLDAQDTARRRNDAMDSVASHTSSTADGRKSIVTPPPASLHSVASASSSKSDPKKLKLGAPAEDGKGCRTQPTTIYEGPFSGLTDQSLRGRYVTPLIEMLREAAMNPDEVFRNWVVRLVQRNAGNNVGHVDSWYFCPSSKHWLRSRIQVARYFGLAEDSRSGGSALASSTSSSSSSKKKRTRNDNDNDAPAAAQNSGMSSASAVGNSTAALPMMVPLSEHVYIDEDEYRLPIWQPDNNGEVPSKRRQKLLNAHITDMKRLLDRLFRIDSFGHFRGEGNKRRTVLRSADRSHPRSLRDIQNRIWCHDYVVFGKECNLRWDLFVHDVESVIAHCMQQEQQQSTMGSVILEPTSSESYSNISYVSKRILEATAETGEAGQQILKDALQKISTDEEIEWLEEKNNEPAMPRWRKELMNAYKYEPLHAYKPAEGLLPEEQAQLLEKLIDHSRKGNRWVYTEGLDMVDLWAQVVALDRSNLAEEMKPLPRISDVLSPEQVVEEHTWGIDSFCRRNIEIALARGRGAFSLTIPEIHCFVEGNLLKAINAVRPVENAWDMRIALRTILDKAKLDTATASANAALVSHQQLQKDLGGAEVNSVESVPSLVESEPWSSSKATSPSPGVNHAAIAFPSAVVDQVMGESESALSEGAKSARMSGGGPQQKTPPPPPVVALAPVAQAEDIVAADQQQQLGRHLIHRRLKIYWPADRAWYLGRIIDFQEPCNFLVAYDDGQSLWENLGSETFKLIGTTNNGAQEVVTLSPHQLRQSCEILLDQCEKKPENFAVHSKGIGVVTQVSIEPGKLVQKYTGILYPCWLWEQKEAKEDAERLQQKRETGETSLPDFWNMRLELPKGQDDEGIDLLYVDAKMGGNFASRMSHSCRPNCGTMTTVIDGQYCIGMRALRRIEAGEELTIDYNCVTDSLDEYSAAICLCGAHDCRGSFLYLTGAAQQMQVVDRSHTPLHRVAMLFIACYGTGELERAFGKPSTDTWPRWIPMRERETPDSTVPKFSRIGRGKKQKAILDSMGGGTSAAASSSSATSKAGKAASDSRKLVSPIAIGRVKPNGLASSPVVGLGPLEVPVQAAPDLAFVDSHESPEELRDDPIVMSVLAERGFGRRALGMLPQWTLRFAAHIVEFIDCEEYELARIEFHKKLIETKASSTRLQDTDERWRIAKFESKGVADQRVTNLLIALDKARHYMCDRLTTNVVVVGGGEGLSMNGIDDQAMSEVDAERSKLRERWWVDDRCLARWIGDDASQWPDWYAATVTHVYVQSQELRVVYDSNHINRIPFSLAKRPKMNEIQPPFTGCEVAFHQPPIRVLDEDSVVFFLWSDSDSGVAARLVRRLLEEQPTEFALWQQAFDSQHNRSYYWNFDTREIRLDVPTQGELEKTTKFEPKVLGQIKSLLNNEKQQPTTAEGARKCLERLRDLLLKVPVVMGGAQSQQLEDMHQKAADLLTFYSMTRNFFVLNEPEMDSGNIHAVINALTSWIGQGMESRVIDITEMVGSALLPPIERAYGKPAATSTAGYCTNVRPLLFTHLKQNGLNDWPKDLIDAFPSASSLPPQPPNLETAWPHPVPPVRLFGSPALDSAIFDHLDYTRACALAKEKVAANSDDDKNLLMLEEDRAQRNLQSLMQLLKEKRRDPGRLDPEDLARLTAPTPPEPKRYNWRQCIRPDCWKWRRLPPGVHVNKFHLFMCPMLLNGDCRLPQDSAMADEATLGDFSADAPNLDPDSIQAGDEIDIYVPSLSQWRIATALAVSDTDVKVSYVFPLSEVKTEWLPKRGKGPGPLVAKLNTFTLKSDLKKVRRLETNYLSSHPDVDPDVIQCMTGIITRLERSVARQQQVSWKKQSVAKQAAVKAVHRQTEATKSHKKRLRMHETTVVDKAMSNSFSGELDTSQKLAFTHYFLKERAYDPEIPFVTCLARFYQLDQAQRVTWHDKSVLNLEFAQTPNEGQSFAGPLFNNSLQNNSSKAITTQQMLLRSARPDPKTRSFLASVVNKIGVGVPVETAYGRGIVVSSNATGFCVHLEWGAKAYLSHSEYEALVPLFSACPGYRPVSGVPSTSVTAADQPLQGKQVQENIVRQPEPESDTEEAVAQKAPTKKVGRRPNNSSAVKVAVAALAAEDEDDDFARVVKKRIRHMNIYEEDDEEEEVSDDDYSICTDYWFESQEFETALKEQWRHRWYHAFLLGPNKFIEDDSVENWFYVEPVFSVEDAPLPPARNTSIGENGTPPVTSSTAADETGIATKDGAVLEENHSEPNDGLVAITSAVIDMDPSASHDAVSEEERSSDLQAVPVSLMDPEFVNHMSVVTTEMAMPFFEEIAKPFEPLPVLESIATSEVEVQPQSEDVAMRETSEPSSVI